VGGAKRPKTGGRVAGTPNKRTQLERDLAAQLGGLIQNVWLAVLSKTPEELSQELGLNGNGALFARQMQIDVAKDAAPYALAKMPQRIAVAGDPEGEPVLVASLTPDEARKLVLERLGKTAL
jgi:hypothetical protein